MDAKNKISAKNEKIMSISSDYEAKVELLKRVHEESQQTVDSIKSTIELLALKIQGIVKGKLEGDISDSALDIVELNNWRVALLTDMQSTIDPDPESEEQVCEFIKREGIDQRLKTISQALHSLKEVVARHAFDCSPI